MKTPNRKIILSVSVALLVMGISAVAFFTVKKDSDLPVYEGKNVRQWFYGEDGNPGSGSTMEAASAAFQKLGTNCVPYLIENLNTQDTVLTKSYFEFFSRMPKSIQSFLPSPVPKNHIISATWLHMYTLKPAVLSEFTSQIVNEFQSLTNQTFTSLPYNIVKGLLKSDIDKNLSTDYLVDLLDHKDFIIRLESAIQISKVNTQITNTIPILLNSSTNRDYLLSLMKGSGIIANLEGFEQMAIRRQKEAHRALTRIAPELAEQYPLEKPQP